MTFNARGIKNSGEELEYYLNSAQPDILRVLFATEKLINSNKFNMLIDIILDINGLSGGLTDTLRAESKPLQATTAATDIC
ncbi:hypothetical protein AYI68_g4181 [Smittium mucronatum]|uniref:Uncharacterized protein n=1 Tax=Smittium mucronatum TaxID=133383 RepID=A0A1R0GXU2_9FUNG|nr:hypothetical protein AYI68_g4181 [Smittium mucronatum]